MHMLRADYVTLNYEIFRAGLLHGSPLGIYDFTSYIHLTS